MSQFESQQFGAPSGPQTTSKLAIWSLVCSLIFFCPLTTLLAPILGLIGLAKIGGNPNLKGKGLCIVGILLGVVFTAGWGYGGYVGIGKMKEWMGVVMSGPSDALAAGFGGDVAGFKAGFYGAGTTASDAEAQAFLDELRNRYGGFVGCSFSQTSQPAQPQPGQPSAPFPYTLEFQNATIDCEAEIIFADQQTGQIIMKLGYIIVADPDAGDLKYPPGG